MNIYFSMDSCLRMFPKNDILYVEFIPDEYVKIQPVSMQDFPEKMNNFKKTVSDLNTFCKKSGMRQVIIIDSDKCVNIFKLNLPLFSKGVSMFAKIFENADILDEVRVIHTSNIIKTVYKVLRRFLPRDISDIINLY